MTHQIIGPTRYLKTPDAISSNARDTTYHIEPGTYPVSIRSVNWQNVFIQSADLANPATLKNDDNKCFGLFQVVGGNVALSDLSFQFAGPHSVVAQTRNNADLAMKNIVQNCGCLYWGSGGGIVQIQDCYSTGKPWKYYVCNFDHPLASLIFKNDGLPPGVGLGHQGNGEAWLRLMQTDHAYLKALHAIRSGIPKEEIQIRSGGRFMLEDVIAENVAAGWMHDPLIPMPPAPIEYVQISGGAIGHVQKDPNIKKIILSNVMYGVGAKAVLTSKSFL